MMSCDTTVCTSFEPTSATKFWLSTEVSSATILPCTCNRSSSEPNDETKARQCLRDQRSAISNRAKRSTRALRP